jgi:ABC-type transporter Mla MlaB component
MKIEAALNFAEVQRLLAAGAEPPADGRLDLSRAGRIDSAGLSFLLEMTRRARTKGIQLQIEGAGEQPLALARFFGVHDLLNFAAR